MEPTPLILSGSQLEGWHPLIEQSILHHPAYPDWYQLVELHYRALLQAHPKFEYRRYQAETAAAYACRPLNLCAGAPGIGKTLITGLMIAAVYHPLTNLPPGTIQITVPNYLSASSRWMVDLERISALKGQVAILRHTTDLPSRAPIWIYSHDFLKRRNGAILSHLLEKRPPELLVIDEIHHFQGRTLRTKALSQLRPVAKRCLGLSGTLSDGRFTMLQTAVSLVYGSAWPYRSSDVLLREFGVRERIATASIKTFRTAEDEPPPSRYLERIALSKLPKYSKTLRQFVHRLTFGDPRVLSSCTLPTLQTHILTVQANPQQLAIYNAAIYKDVQQLQQLAQYGHTINDRANALELLHPLFKTANDPLIAAEKWNQLQTLVHTYTHRQQKVVIFSASIDNSRLLSEQLNQMFPHQVVRLYATDKQASPPIQTDAQRLDILYRFQYDPSTTIGVFSLNLASESIDLTAATALIFWDLPWQTLKILQAIYRACRPGAVSPSTDVYYLTTQGLLDEYMHQLATQKMKASKLLLDFSPEELPQSPQNITPFEMINLLLASERPQSHPPVLPLPTAISNAPE